MTAAAISAGLHSQCLSRVATAVNGGSLLIFSGVRPAKGAAASNPLCAFLLGTPGATVTGEQLTFAPIPSTRAVRAGVPTWGRILASDNSFVMDLDVGPLGPSGDLLITLNSHGQIDVGSTVQIGSLRIGTLVYNATFNVTMADAVAALTGTVPTSITILGPWSEYPDITLKAGGPAFDISTWVTGEQNVNWSVIQLSGPSLSSLGINVTGSLMSAAANAPPTSTTMMSSLLGPQVYVRLRQINPATGAFVDTTIPISVIVGGAAPVVYSVQSISSTTFPTMAAAQVAAATTDKITFTPGFPSDFPWMPRAGKSLTVVCSDPTLFAIHDCGGVKGAILWNGEAGSAPTNCSMDVSNVWCRNSKNVDTVLVDSDPGGQQGACAFSQLCDGTQKWTVRNSIFEDCVEASVSANNMGPQAFYNCWFINCGAATGNASCHGHYFHGISMDFRGNSFRWTFGYDQAPVGKKRWASDGHDLKTRCGTNLISGNRWLTSIAAPFVSASTTEKIDLDTGVCYVLYNQIEEGLNSAYQPANNNGNTAKIDNKIIGYGTGDDSGTEFRDMRLYMYGNTIKNNGQPTENFLRMIVQFGKQIVPLTGADPSSMSSGSQIGVNVTTNVFTLNQVIATMPNGKPLNPFANGRAMYAGMPFRITFFNGASITPLNSGRLVYAVPLPDASNSHFGVAATPALAVAGTLLDLTAAAPGTGSGNNILFEVAPLVFDIKDNVFAGLTMDSAGTQLSLDDAGNYVVLNTVNKYFPDMSQFVDPNALNQNFALTSVLPASKIWTDPTGASDYFKPT